MEQAYDEEEEEEVAPVLYNESGHWKIHLID